MGTKPMEPQKLFRADKRDFSVGDTVLYAGEFLDKNPTGSTNIEKTFEDMCTNRLLEKVDVFPVCTKSPSQMSVILAKQSGIPINHPKIYAKPHDILPEIISNNGNCAENSAVKDALLKSDVYKVWRKSMPRLKDVPNISNYRNGAKHLNDVDEINKEILATGAFLPKNQLLYRGDVFREEVISYKDGPISTSMMPSVALWHAREVSGDVAILRIAQEHSIQAFVFGVTGNQRNTQEFEVLLRTNIFLQRTNEMVIPGMRVVEYDVYAINT